VKLNFVLYAVFGVILVLLEEVDKFCYLVDMLDADGVCDYLWRRVKCFVILTDNSFHKC